MEKVRPWCGQPSDQARLKNRTEQSSPALGLCFDLERLESEADPASLVSRGDQPAAVDPVVVVLVAVLAVREELLDVIASHQQAAAPCKPQKQAATVIVAYGRIAAAVDPVVVVLVAVLGVREELPDVIASHQQAAASCDRQTQHTSMWLEWKRKGGANYLFTFVCLFICLFIYLSFFSLIFLLSTSFW